MYDLYKPLRNFLRRHSLWSGLGTVYYYFQYLQFEAPLPEVLQTPAIKLRAPRLQIGLFEWQLELLARELILNGEMRAGKSFAAAAPAFKALGMIHQLEGAAWRGHGRSEDIMLEMSRIAHRQFPWQTSLTNTELARHYALFAHPRVARLLEIDLGITPGELFQFILLLIEECSHRPTPAFAFLKAADPSILPAMDALISRLSSSAHELRSMTRELQSYDVNWAYTFNPLRAFPLVHGGNPRSVVCPIPPFLTQRLTDGLYFDLIGSSEFGDAVGDAFEEYIGECASRVADGAMTILPEQRYGREEKRSVDWIISDSSAALFVECKLARLTLAAKTEISVRDPLHSALKRMAANIVQLYATLTEAMQCRYPHWQPDARPIYPLVVTFYNWFTFGPRVHRQLDELVGKAFDERGLDRELLSRHPFSICSIEEFEGLIEAARTANVDAVMKEKSCGEMREWLMRSCLDDRFPGSIHRASELFKSDIDAPIFGPSRLTRRNVAGASGT